MRRDLALQILLFSLVLAPAAHAGPEGCCIRTFTQSKCAPPRHRDGSIADRHHNICQQKQYPEDEVCTDYANNWLYLNCPDNPDPPGSARGCVTGEKFRGLMCEWQTSQWKSGACAKQKHCDSRNIVGHKDYKGELLWREWVGIHPDSATGRALKLKQEKRRLAEKQKIEREDRADPDAPYKRQLAELAADAGQPYPFKEPPGVPGMTPIRSTSSPAKARAPARSESSTGR